MNQRKNNTGGIVRMLRDRKTNFGAAAAQTKIILWGFKGITLHWLYVLRDCVFWKDTHLESNSTND